MQNIKNKIENSIPKDKLLHFTLGLLLALLAFVWVWFIFLPIVVGLLNELYDKYVRKTGFNWWDLLATVSGVVPVLAVLMFLYLIKG